MQAGSLDISVFSETGGLQLGGTALNLLAGESVFRNFEVENKGTENAGYRIEFQKDSGSDSLCSALQVDLTKNSTAVYSGNLNSIAETGLSLNSGDTDEWGMTIELPEESDTSLQRLDCNFDVYFNSWIQSKTEATSGWNDEELLSGNEITTGAWQDVVLNEFVPNPIGDDDAPIPKGSDDDTGEWVELYNRGDLPVDVAGWYLYDAYDDHELIISASNSDNNGDTDDAGETIVPVGGFLVVYRNGDSDFSLNNSGDEEVRLFDGHISSANLIDSHAYNGSDFDELSGTPLAGNVEDQSGSSNSSIPEGKSFIRYPDGFDNWIDPIPTPGQANDDENGEDALLEYYKDACFDKKDEPICEEDFMKELGIWEEDSESEKAEEKENESGKNDESDAAPEKNEKKIIPEINPEPVEPEPNNSGNTEGDDKKGAGGEDAGNNEENEGSNRTLEPEKNENNGDGEDSKSENSADGEKPENNNKEETEGDSDRDDSGENSEELEPEPKESEEQKPDKPKEEPKKTEEEEPEKNLKKDDTGKEEEPEEKAGGDDDKKKKDSDDEKVEADKSSSAKASGSKGKKKENNENN